MTDLLGDAGTTPIDAAGAAGLSTPFPPPPPRSLDDGIGTRRQRILAVIGAVALLAAVVLALLWISAARSRDDAAAARDAARASAALEADRADVAEDELATAQADLEALRAANEQLAADLATAQAATAATATAAEEQAAEAEADLDALGVQNQELADEIDALQQSLADATAAGTTPDDAATSDAGAPPADEPTQADVAFDIAGAPEFARYIGETLSSRTGSSRLGQAESTCFGTAIVDDIGLDALGKGLHLAASSTDNDVVVGAMQRAATSCNIDLGLIF